MKPTNKNGSNLVEKLEWEVSALKEKFEGLKRIPQIEKKLEGIEFPVEVNYRVSSDNDTDLIRFYPPGDMWICKCVFRKVLHACVRHFKARFKQKLNEYSGTYYWKAKVGDRLEIKIESAPISDRCRIEKVEYTATKYKSVCD